MDNVMQHDMTRHEQALELFAASIWRSAAMYDNREHWGRTYEKLIAVENYLNLLGYYAVAEVAADLKKLAAARAETPLLHRLYASR